MQLNQFTSQSARGHQTAGHQAVHSPIHGRAIAIKKYLSSSSLPIKLILKTVTELRVELDNSVHAELH